MPRDVFTARRKCQKLGAYFWFDLFAKKNRLKGLFVILYFWLFDVLASTLDKQTNDPKNVFFDRLFTAEQIEYSEWKELKGQIWKNSYAKDSKRYISLDATLGQLEKYHDFRALRKTCCSLVNIDSQKILCFNRERLSCSSLPYAPRLLVASPCVGSGSLQATTGPKKKNRAPGVYRVEKMAKQSPMALIRHRVPLHPRMLTWNLKMSSKVMNEGISAPIIMHGEL